MIMVPSPELVNRPVLFIYLTQSQEQVLWADVLWNHRYSKPTFRENLEDISILRYYIIRPQRWLKGRRGMLHSYRMRMT